MHTLSTNDIRGFRTQEAIHTTAAWRAEILTHRGTQFRSTSSTRPSAPVASETTESQPIASEPKTPELPDEDFPFSALIRLVRLMRE
jgi:hypothetical protein